MVLQFWESKCSLCCVVRDLMVFAVSSHRSIRAGCVDAGTGWWLLLARFEHCLLLVMSLVPLV